MGTILDKEQQAFTGSDEGEYPVERFIANLEVVANVSGWTDADTAANAVKAMTGKIFN
jgi:hypothetical protein